MIFATQFLFFSSSPSDFSSKSNSNRSNNSFISADSIPELEGFDIELYYDVSTTDSERSKMRDDYLSSSFRKKFPELGDMSLAQIQRATSMDSSIRAFYTKTQGGFQKLTTLPNIFFLSLLSPEDQKMVRDELERATQANSVFTEAVNKAVQIKDRSIEAAEKTRSQTFLTLSALTQVAFLTIEHVPISYKTQILKAEKIEDVKKDMANIVRKYKLECIKLIKANGGMWPEGVKPF